MLNTFLYLLVAGAFAAALWNNTEDEEREESGAFILFAAIAWPLFLPILLGFMTYSWLSGKGKE